MMLTAPSIRLRAGWYTVSPPSPDTVTSMLGMMSLTLPRRHTGVPSALSYSTSPTGDVSFSGS